METIAIWIVGLLYIMFGVFITLLWQDRQIWKNEEDEIESRIDTYIEQQIKPWK